MRISDWSSDVCSSDLYAAKPRSIGQPINTIKCDNRSAVIVPTLVRVAHGSIDKFGKKRGRGDHDINEPLPTQSTPNEFAEIGRASCRERVCQYVSISGGAVTLKKKT